MRKLADSKKFICLIAIFSVFFCSFLGMGNGNVSVSDGTAPLNPVSYVSSDMNLDVVMNVEEISASSSQTAVIRQLSTRRNSAGLLVVYTLLNVILPALFFILFSLHNLCTYAESKSHRLIITFIHNKDGQKTA